MADQNAGSAGGNSRLKRNPILIPKGFQRAVIPDESQMGISVGAIAGKVFENAANPALLHLLDHRRYIGSSGLCIFSQGAAVNIISGIDGQVANRCKIDIDAKIQQEGRFVGGVAHEWIPFPLARIAAGRREG